jgi:choline dehydrogenase-like flavoprotein
MFDDAREVPSGTVLESDICIVGAGAAGIAIALELGNSGLDVLLLESGGLEPDTETQSLYVGTNVGVGYFGLDVSRLRVFGGTTLHWAGVCRPLDPIDFTVREWVPHSGWPIDYDDVAPWYDVAQRLCEVGEYDYSSEGWEAAGNPRYQLDESRVRTSMSRLSPPTRFGLHYRDALEQLDNVRMMLWANVVDVSTSGDGRHVEQVRVRTLSGNELHARARRFVLATGALENARLLLVSRQGDHAVGNRYDCVGRYFIEHPRANPGVFLPADSSTNQRLYLEETVHPEEGLRGRAFFVPTPAAQRQEGLLNCRAHIENAPQLQTLRVQSSGGIAAVNAARDAARDRSAAEVMLHLATALRSIDDIAVYTYRRFIRPPPPVSAYPLLMHVEQAPDPDSRVTLGEDHDALGLPRLTLDWRLGEPERHTFRRFCEMLGEEFGAAGLGRVQVLDEDPVTGLPVAHRGSWHQMGTTRMSASPRTGVVDADCRLHDVENLYVAGSSVFPTSGHANPTLTIVALAARLANHLRQVT